MAFEVAIDFGTELLILSTALEHLTRASLPTPIVCRKITVPVPKLSSITPAVIIATLVSLLGGGFAGAVFTWLIHQPSPALVTYTITTTNTGADPLVKGLIPNLKLKIGDEDIPVVYTHVLDLACVRGDYVDSADFAITFPAGLRMFGFDAKAPSAVHSVTCKQACGGIICRVSPLSPGTKYQVSIAGTEKSTPAVITSSRNTELISLDAFVSRESRSLRTILTSKEGGAVAMVIILYLTLIAFLWKIRRRPLILVGKLIDHSGTPIAGAVVRANLEHPAQRACNYAATKTDVQGDFLFGGLTKQDLSGTIQVEHGDYTPLKMHFDSPIIVATLDPNMQPPEMITNKTPLAVTVRPKAD